MTTVKDNLIAAKALIDTPEKWIKGRYHDGGFHGFDCHCSIGACLAVAIPGSADIHGMGDALVYALPKPWEMVADFNDAPETTHADIMALFDRAISAQDDSHAS